MMLSISRIKRIEEKLFSLQAKRQSRATAFFKRRSRFKSHVKCDKNSCNSVTKKNNCVAISSFG
jgi:hypothetical protein